MCYSNSLPRVGSFGKPWAHVPGLLAHAPSHCSLGTGVLSRWLPGDPTTLLSATPGSCQACRWLFGAHFPPVSFIGRSYIDFHSRPHVSWTLGWTGDPVLANESTDLPATPIGLEEACDKVEPVKCILRLWLEVIFFFPLGC